VVTESRSDVDFLVLDIGGWSDLSLTVVDDATGLLFEPNYHVEIESGLRTFRTSVPVLELGGIVLAKSWPNDRPGRFRVRAEGYLSTERDLAIFLPIRAGDRPTRSATVRLERGADIAFECRRADENGTLFPLPGVEVHLDGTLAATSGDDGRAAMQVRSVPRKVSFVKPGWRPFSAPFDLENAVLDDLRAMEYYVVFERNE
jgi:hypothetical protein